MLRFLLFSGNDHHPLGGMLDFDDSYDTVEGAMSGVDPSRYRHAFWAQVFDQKEGVVSKCCCDGVWSDAKDSEGFILFNEITFGKRS